MLYKKEYHKGIFLSCDIVGNELYVFGKNTLSTGDFVYIISSKKIGGSFEYRTKVDLVFNEVEKVVISDKVYFSRFGIKPEEKYQLNGDYIEIV
ncbi:TPA: hypothetical protein RY759_002329 [Staphylococcus aureus]|nr:hypothetical protein [Staphylococcus aureus]MBH4598609.1 hypothetical protein [Staphylococcus aureus]HDG8500874.1 hypothetical protein [Staphylococcus aureus]HDG8588264.1 hypothetical protein [Staphylococcus aureus]HDZ3299499.1 hypothetical protein [Staphylococcus aureus]